MNLLFITHANLTNRAYGDGSTRYRCFNVAEIASTYGHKAQIIELDKLRLKDLPRFDLISWLRPVPSRKAYDILNRATSLNIPCVADTDDLIFDPNLAVESPAVINGFVSAQKMEKRFAAHARILQHFNAITVSTTTLQKHVQRCFTQMPVTTIHNGLSDYWLAHVHSVQPSFPKPGRLGYLPGTRSHDQDLASIFDVINQWLQKATTASLEIVGKLDIPEHITPSAKIRRHPWVDYFQLPAVMKQYCALLAPLTTTSFNTAKSHVKFIESAALGIPLIASPNDDFTQHNCPGLLFANSAEQWLDALMLVSQPDYYVSTSAGLYQYAREFCSAHTYARPLIQAWEAGNVLPEAVKEFTFAQAA